MRMYKKPFPVSSTVPVESALDVVGTQMLSEVLVILENLGHIDVSSVSFPFFQIYTHDKGKI